MPDRRARERDALLRAFAAHALREHEVAPDGHCLFAAVADQLAANGVPLVPAPLPGAKAREEKDEGEPPYRVVRRVAADWIARHRDEYAGFIDEGEGQGGGLDDYVARIRDSAEWGGQLELSALANAYRVEIRVVQDGRVEVIRPSAAAAAAAENTEGEGKEEEEMKTLWLAYYRFGFGLGEHYNSLRKAG